MIEFKDEFIYSIIDKCEVKTIPNELIIIDDMIRLITYTDVTADFFYMLSFLDPILKQIYKDISFLNYKAFYSKSITKSTTYMNNSNKEHNIYYTAYYNNIFDALCDVGCKKTQKIALLI